MAGQEPTAEEILLQMAPPPIPSAKPITDPNAAPAPKDERPAVRFYRTMSPGEPVTLKDGTVVKFHRPRQQDGRFADAGHVDVRDPVIISGLREMEKAGLNYVLEHRS